MTRPKRLLGLLSAFFVLVLAPAAHAVTVTLSQTPAEPVVGEQVSITAHGSDDCAFGPYTFTVDGTTKPTQATDTYVTTFSTTGDHTVTAFVAGGCDQQGGTSPPLTITVKAALVGTILATPAAPGPGETVSLEATQTGGIAGYTYLWDLDNDGAFDDSSIRTPQTSFATTGPHVVRVQITDSAGPPHTAIATKTIDVQVHASPTPGATPTPTPCTNDVTVGISEFKTTGCFTKTGNQWTTRSAVKLNGILFPDFGQTFTITDKTTAEPGGHFSAPDSTIQLEGFKAFSGDIDWTLPDGKQGDAPKTVKTISIALGSKMFGLNVKGTSAVQLGWNAQGHYATFPLTIEMPAGIYAGPNYEDSRATGTSSLKVDDTGPHFDGLKLSAQNVWAGKLKLVQACLSFIPANGQSVDACPTPSLDGHEYLGCSSNVTTDRWDGNAVIELPTANHTQIGAFAGLAGGQVSKLGGFVDQLGNTVALAPGVFLDRIGVGLCLTPPPLKFRGDVGVGILPVGGSPSVTVDGNVTYTDAYQSSPWTMEFGGTINVRGTRVGTGGVTLRGSGGIDFRLQAGFNLFNVASLEGEIKGWVDTAREMFDVEGSVKACISGDDICAQGSGLVSNIGVAGCVTIVSHVIDYGTIIITLNPVGAHFQDQPTVITAGFGYRWGDSAPDIFGGSCNFTPYRPVRQFRSLGGPLTQTVKPGTVATAWKIHGTNDAPPKIIVKGPGGTTIQSPTDATSAQSKGKWMLAENTPEGTTNLLLIGPKPGTYTIEGVMGAMSTPDHLDVSESEAPPTVAAKVSGRGHRRTLDVAYAVPKGTVVRLAEVAPGVSRVIAPSLSGSRCPHTPKTRPGTDQAVLCAHLKFTPARGPGGPRKIQAVVTRGGIPLSQKTVATYIAPRELLPATASALKLERKKSTLLLSFPRLRGAVRYIATAKLSDGRSLGFDLGAKCRQLQIPAVPRNVAAKLTLAGMRYDLETGKESAIKIKRNQKAKAKGRLPRTKGKRAAICH